MSREFGKFFNAIGFGVEYIKLLYDHQLIICGHDLVHMYFQSANRKKNYVWLQRKWVHKTEIQQHYRYTRRMQSHFFKQFI